MERRKQRNDARPGAGVSPPGCILVTRSGARNGCSFCQSNREGFHAARRINVRKLMNTNDAKRRVLIVDDDPVTLKCLERMLARAGFEGVAASSGEEAIIFLNTEHFAEHFDAVVSDVNMPRMTGFDLLENSLIRFPELPVILMTASRLEGLQETARICGARALLEKPVRSEDLIAAITPGLPDVALGKETTPAEASLTCGR